jgi:triosephosphate isomerase (TIM)
MRKKIIAGNWKMHFTTHDASLLVHKLTPIVPIHADVEVILAPSFLALSTLSLQINHRQFKLAAQNCDWRDEGAFTGEVAATMLRGLTSHVIIGHSERRHVFHEHHTEIRKKVQAVIRNGMRPILCVGETATEKADGETKHVLHDQIVSGLANLTSEELGELVVAYEPVWAIGTGNNARPEDAASAVGYIRQTITSLYGQAASDMVRVLYGGSTKASNAKTYLDIDGVDGLLVGGASLVAEEFAAIVTAAHSQHKKG